MIRLSVLERNHISIKYPEDYIDTMQSDSESVNDLFYIQGEQNAPVSQKFALQFATASMSN